MTGCRITGCGYAVKAAVGHGGKTFPIDAPEWRLCPTHLGIDERMRTEGCGLPDDDHDWERIGSRQLPRDEIWDEADSWEHHEICQPCSILFGHAIERRVID